MGDWDRADAPTAAAELSRVPGSSRLEQFSQAIAERVVNLVMDAIDVNAILERVDVERIIERVDVDRIVERVDVERIIERVDVERIVQRVDVSRIVDQIDIDAILEQTELGTIIARSTTGVASEALDVVRAQAVGLDDFVARWMNRILRRQTDDLPLGPPNLVGGNVASAAPTAGPT